MVSEPAVTSTRPAAQPRSASPSITHPPGMAPKSPCLHPTGHCESNPSLGVTNNAPESEITFQTMYELKEDLQRAKNNYTPPHISYVLDSIVEQNTPGQIFVNNLDLPSISITWDKGPIFYFGSTVNDEVEYKKAAGFLKEEILNTNVKKRLGVAKLYYPSTRWEKVILDSFKEYNPSIRMRRINQHNLENIPPASSSTGNIVIKEIDHEIGSKDKFLDHGFGYCALVDGEIVCRCRAEYVSKSFCGIGISTDEKFRRRGLASITTSKILEKCKQLGITPYWESWKKNIPSIKVAEKMGFKKLYDYKIIFLQFYK